MSGSGQIVPATAAHNPQDQHREQFIPPILVNSLKVGGCTGALGVFIGAATGVIRARPPALTAAIAGVQWFTLGATYYGSRAVTIAAWGGEQALSPADKIKASTIAGGFAGAASGLLGGGPRGIPPVVIAFSLLGAGGQAVASAMAERNPQNSGRLASRWSPLKRLTDREYEMMLEEKLLKLDVEIALVDDKIAAVKNSVAIEK